MRKKKMPIWKKGLIVLACLLVTFILTGYILRLWLGISPPEIQDKSTVNQEIIKGDNGQMAVGSSRFRHSESGLWEIYLEGNAFDRGVAAGKMYQDLLHYQEDVFVGQIRKIVPSDFYLMFLRNLIGFFNRNLSDNIQEEFKEEIYGISLSCSHEYDFIGTPYERQLNYHAAHDLGHAMQDYMLVGCTSFACWQGSTEDSTLLIGRNFDFYVGDDFAKNKVVYFYNPDQGYKFSTVSWAGMTGVLSGMNEKGLTISINAAKSSMPTSSATPISILCREILQYASTIEEAYSIAKKRKTFVSESILIGSSIDNRAAIIEKSPEKIGLFESRNNSLVSANHYQSDVFKEDEGNLENIRTSDSPYRQKRMKELISRNQPLNPKKAAAILRDKNGLEDQNIGLGNEKAINQLICHHSVIFEPQKRLMWVSTSPWQIGKYVCYDLNRIFSNPDFSSEVKTDSLTIPADTFIQTKEYANFLQYRTSTGLLTQSIRKKEIVDDNWIENYVSTNPEFYYVYDLAGDYYSSRKNTQKAINYWETALKKEIPKLGTKENIEKKIQQNRNKQ